MMSVSQREKIVNSYSKILSDIVLNHQNARQYFLEMKNICDEIKIDKICANPMNIKEYKNTLAVIKENICNDDELQKFLFLVLNRKYGILMREIIKKAEYDISKKLSTNNVIVSSKKELSNDVKDSVSRIIMDNSNTEHVSIRYTINANMADGDIEIVSNGKICVLDVNNAVRAVLSK